MNLNSRNLMKNFDFDFKPKDYYEKNIKKEDLLTPKDIEEFVVNELNIDFDVIDRIKNKILE